MYSNATSLVELEITHNQSKTYQSIASIPEPAFNEFILILFDDGSHILRSADDGSFDYPSAGFRVDFVNDQLANHLPTIDPG